MLAEATEKAADYLKGVYGPRSLKRIVSASVIVLSQLSSEQLEQAMAAADGAQQKILPNPEAVREVLKKFALTERQNPGTIIKVLSQEDSVLIDEVRKSLGPEQQKQKRKIRGVRC